MTAIHYSSKYSKSAILADTDIRLIVKNTAHSVVKADIKKNNLQQAGIATIIYMHLSKVFLKKYDENCVHSMLRIIQFRTPLPSS